MKLPGLLVISSALLTLTPCAAPARSDKQVQQRQSAEHPFVSVAVHRVNRVGLTVTNTGNWGNGLGFGVSPDGVAPPSCEFPLGSGISYLFSGALWVGAVVYGDTLVSTGYDGWTFIQEFWPADSQTQANRDELIQSRSIKDNDGPNDTTAKSEQDIVAVYTDTLVSGIAVDAFDNRLHKPLHLRVKQTSMAWSIENLEDFIIFDLEFTNISDTGALRDTYVGLFFDTDIGHPGDVSFFMDDIAGFHSYTVNPPGANINCSGASTITGLAWSADNDGINATDSLGQIATDYDISSDPTGVFAIRLLGVQNTVTDTNFNWWLSNGDPSLDFGPRQSGTFADPFRDFGGFIGTPEGDRNKYYILSHPEKDYDQLATGVDHATEGWLAPPPNAGDLADGFDTRFLLSFGPFNLFPGDRTTLTFALVMGEGFHTDPQAMNTLFHPQDPRAYQRSLDFSDLERNATFAGWVYDNPGIDTDRNGYQGEFEICCDNAGANCDTAWLTGDGVPDYRGVAPPPAPEAWIESAGDRLIVHWNGLKSETTPDRFVGSPDFAGYNVYLGNSNERHSLALQASYDREDFWVYRYDFARERFFPDDIALSRDEIRTRFAPNDPGFSPLKYTSVSPLNYDGGWVYFEPAGWNISDLDDGNSIHKPARYRYNLLSNGDFKRDSLGQPLLTPYPHTLIIDSAFTTDTFLVDSLSGDTAWYLGGELTEDGERFKYFEYEYTIPNLSPVIRYYVSVTAFDFGAPRSSVPPQESRRAENAELAYSLAGPPSENVFRNVLVVPNPYYHDGRAFGAVDPRIIDPSLPADGLGGVSFFNLPPVCQVQIRTLDGDLVFVADYESAPEAASTTPLSWNLITRTGGLALSGIYYWVVSTPAGHDQIGRLVLIM